MKIKNLLFAAILCAAFGATSALAAEWYVAPAPAGNDGNTCTSGNPCATVQHVIGIASPGDTINIASGTYTEGGVAINLDFLTIKGPNAGTPGFGARGAEAIFDASVGGPNPWVFNINANNVTIDGITINVTSIPSVWAGIHIEPGGQDRWTIQNNIITGVEGMNPASVAGDPNRSFGVYGDAQITSGTDTMTGGLLTGNYIHLLGFGGGGADVTSGVGVYLEGIEGDDADCDPTNRFTCGVWIYNNHFEDLYTGKNLALQGITTPGGKEYSYGIIVAQDDENMFPNNGAWIGGNSDIPTDGNQYFDDNILAHGTNVTPEKLEIGVGIGIGGSTVSELNANFNGEVIAYVLNDDRKATIEELPLAEFFKTLFPRVFGQGSDMYFAEESQAKFNSDDSATIVNLVNTTVAAAVSTAEVPEIFEHTEYELIVEARGESASFKVSKDSNGNLNVRQGARLLFKGAYTDLTSTDGVDEIVLEGTSGKDLLTIDFNNGNPVPLGLDGIDYIAGDGFDTMTLRGDEQIDHQTINHTGSESGFVYFEPVSEAGSELPKTAFADETNQGFGTTTRVKFDGLKPIEDLLIVNGDYAVVAPNDVDHEINVINGPFRFGFETFQINSGAEKTFEEINFANKKNVKIYGGDDFGSGDGNDVFTIFTKDGDTPNLLLNVNFYGGSLADDLSDDYFVIRPSKDFEINVSGGSHDDGDWLFLDCAKTAEICDPADIIGLSGTYNGLFSEGFKDLTYDTIELTALNVTTDLEIRKELIGFAADGAHPGDDVTYRITLRNNILGTTVDLTSTPVWITDVIDHSLSLVEQSVVVESGSVQVTGSNTSMLWLINDISAFAPGDEISMTYTTIVNTLITTEDIHNYASILNPDALVNQWVENGPEMWEHFGHVDLDVLDVFGFPVKAAIQASLFYETEAGPRYMVGLYGGAKDPTQGNIGSMLCRVPDTNQEVGWDGGLGNLWYSCGEGLPNIDNIFQPLVVTDLYQDSAGRIWLTSWGFDGLYYSDDGAQTWTSALADLSGGQGGSPDGIPDGFAQIYAITEDILGTLYISANNGDVYRSFDRGVTWQKSKQLPLGSADTAFSLQADPTVPGKVYAGTFGDSLYVTSDFAETWQRPEGNGLGNGYIFDIEIDPISGNLFVGTAKGIFYSADEGDNWTGLNNAFPFPTNPPEIRNIAFDENGSLFASTWGQGVWSSLDWQASSLSLFALKNGNVLDMYVSDGFVYTLTEFGATQRIAYEALGFSVDTDDLASELPAKFQLDQNYPNPFNPTTSIRFNLPQSVQVNLTVFDVLGRRVATLVNDQMSAGTHQVTFQAAGLPSGMYLYRLSTPNGSLTQKMLLLK